MRQGQENPAERGGERRANSEIFQDLNAPRRSRLPMPSAPGSSLQTVRPALEVTRNPEPTAGQSSSTRKRGLRATGASTSARRRKTRRADAPTAPGCCRIAPPLRETKHNTAAGFDRPEMRASSARPTRPRDAGSHAQSCARNGSPDFSAY